MEKSYTSTQSGFVHLGLLVIFSLSLAVIIASQIQTTSHYPDRPTQVLGDQSDSSTLVNNYLPYVQLATDAISTREIDTITSPNTISLSDEQQANGIVSIDGIKTRMILGFLPVTTGVRLTISAQSGNLLSKQQSVLSQMLSLLS